jgi:hypothetical protein
MAPMNPRLLRPLASGKFTPTQLSGLVGWWDAEATGTLFQNSAGTTPVTATNDVVGYWGDLSGNGNHLQERSGSNKPVWIASELNNRPVLRFDGVSATLRRSFTLAQPCTHWFVFKFNGPYVSGSPRAWDGFRVDGQQAGFFRNASATSMQLNAGVNQNSGTVTDAEMKNYGVWDTLMDGAGSAINRAGALRTTTGGNSGTNNPNGLSLAVFSNGTTAPGDVSFAEMIIYNRALAASEAAQVRRYLGKKYNLPYA